MTMMEHPPRGTVVSHQEGDAGAENGKSVNGSSSDSFARNLLDALMRFRDGDFDSRMPRDHVGIEGKIADVVNDILTTSERRADETARVCRDRKSVV